MKNTLVICCLIVAALFFSAIQAQSLCETLSLRAVGGDKTEEAFVVLWVNASFAAYAANPSFGSAFTNPSDATWAAHVSFYGSLIGCTTINATTFPIANDNMTDVHNFTIPAADFEAYVELTRQALQSVVPDAIVAEVTQFYQIFESFHESNSTTKSTICNQPDCQEAETVTINDVAPPITFSDSYIPLSALSLAVDNPTPEAVDLYFIASTATDCSSAALLQEIQPDELAQTLDLIQLPESGVYYIYQVTAPDTECFLNTTVFTTNVLILDFIMPPALPPVDVPIADAPVAVNITEPVAAPVNVTEPVAAPLSNETVPIATPIAPPVSNDTVPVDPPAEPVAAPVTIEVPVDAPVAAVPISAPVSDGNITPSAPEQEFKAGGYIAGIVILVLIVIGLLIAVIVMGVRLRRNSTVVVA